MKNKKFLIAVILVIAIISLLPAQSGFPLRTEWRSPDGSLPMSYREWKAQWDSQTRLMGGEVKYRSKILERTLPDSFVFGNDYAHYMAYVRHQDNSLCTKLPPITSFIVVLNHDDNKILTDQSPRWSFGDPNISGLGWIGIELGNFNDPPIAIGDSFSIIFTCYNENEQFEQGTLNEGISYLPFYFPGNLRMQFADVPRPPDSLHLKREGTANRLSWNQRPGLSYTIYRRNVHDTLTLNFPRYQYEKIAENIIDSVFFDTTIDTSQIYGYLIFSTDTLNGLQSGRSQEINGIENFPGVRAILVQPELYAGIQTGLSQLITDWEAEGAAVVVYAMQFPHIQALRDTLKAIEHLEGALLIGDFPVPWFQHCNENGQDYQEFPVDLYYMDLDGDWKDLYHYVPNVGLSPGPDGIYDTHTATFPKSDEAPEIVVGRITPTPGMGDAVEIINFYLDKCYRYRHNIGDIRQNFRALAYPDDDWDTWGHQVATDYLSQAYPDYDCIYHINATTATDYRARLDEHYSLIHVYVHSWSGGHAFSVQNGTQTEYFFNTHILPANTNANFFLLFACGNSRYIEDKNCAAIYAFQTQAGINTIGTTHSGGMLDYDYFYPELAKKIPFGEAFLKTLQHVGYGGFTHDLQGWYYGMTFNGDPFMVPQPRGTAFLSERETPLTPTFDLRNYPNPFNSFTSIQFNLPQQEQVTLTLTNSLGQKVKTILRERLNPGAHEIIFNAGDLPSGIYFCTLRAGGLEQTRPFIIIK